MPHELLDSISKYGYLILFLLVFIQEMGVPTFPNEITLCYFGYLCSQDIYSLSQSILIAVSADILGTSLLYWVFFFFARQFCNSKHEWLRKIVFRVESAQYKKKYTNNFSFFLGRVTPFIRGYVSVYAGIKCLPFKIYFLQVIASALVFTGGFITIGFCFANHFQKFLLLTHLYYTECRLIVVIMICFLILKWCYKKIWFVK